MTVLERRLVTEWSLDLRDLTAVVLLATVATLAIRLGLLVDTTGKRLARNRICGRGRGRTRLRSRIDGRIGCCGLRQITIVHDFLSLSYLLDTYN
jgi:hypothetical protein